MKKLYIGFILCLTGLVMNSQLNFTATNPGGSFSITCSNPSLNIVAISNYTAPVIYGWTGPGTNLTGASISLSNPGTYTVIALSNSLSVTQTFVVGSNTVTPSSQLSPAIQTIVCNPVGYTPIVTVVAVSPSTTIQHTIFSPGGAIFVANTFSTTYVASMPGTYTYVLTNLLNGCETVKNFTIVGPNHPVFNLSSVPGGFTLGCSTKSLTTVNISSVITFPLGNPTTYTLLPPGGSTIIPLPPALLSAVSLYSLNVPGTYTMVIRDNISFCDSRLAFSVLQNTISPGISSIIVPKQILDCTTSSVLVTANSTNQNVSYNWLLPGTLNLSSNTLVVNSLTATPNQTLIANFTLSVTDNDNLCKTTTLVPIYQNIFPPLANINSGGLSNLTCQTPSILLTNTSVSGVPVGVNFPHAPVIGLLWQGPSPLASATNTTTYLANAGGVYSLDVQDSNNGCKSFTTVVINDTRVLPNVAAPSGPYTVSCPSGVVNISPAFTGPSGGYSYNWIVPSGAVTSGNASSTLTTNSSGSYSVTVTNTATGCFITIPISVWACVGLENAKSIGNSISVYPNPSSGVIYIQIKESTYLYLKMEVYNLLGELVRSTAITERNTVLDLEKEPTGVYFLKFSNGGEMNYTSRIIIKP